MAKTMSAAPKAEDKEHVQALGRHGLAEVPKGKSSIPIQQLPGTKTMMLAVWRPFRGRLLGRLGAICGVLE
eukprot:3807265-Pyramimonas_sp.AAC.1